MQKESLLFFCISECCDSKLVSLGSSRNIGETKVLAKSKQCKLQATKNREQNHSILRMTRIVSAKRKASCFDVENGDVFNLRRRRVEKPYRLQKFGALLFSKRR
jgi:hypothetical protein